jgi:hypothetical protein
MYVGLHVKYRYSSHILTKPEFSREIFEKYANIILNENPPSGSRMVPCRRTDGLDETNSRFSEVLQKAIISY